MKVASWNSIVGEEAVEILKIFENDTYPCSFGIVDILWPLLPCHCMNEPSYPTKLAELWIKTSDWYKDTCCR